MREGYVGDALEEALDAVGSDTISISVSGSNKVRNISEVCLRCSSKAYLLPFFCYKIVTRDPKLCQYVNVEGFQNFGKGYATEVRVASLFGSGIIWVDGPLWKLHRECTKPFFSE